jgi:hypothetical protein
MNAIPIPETDPSRVPTAFRVFLRVYGVLTLAIFVLLFVGFIAQSPLLAEHSGPLNWTIWNDVRCGSEHLHVPPMLMVIYIVGGLSAARRQRPARLCVVSDLHDVGQPCARGVDGRASRHRDRSLLEQVSHRHTVRAHPCARNIPLASRG